MANPSHFTSASASRTLVRSHSDPNVPWKRYYPPSYYTTLQSQVCASLSSLWRNYELVLNFTYVIFQVRRRNPRGLSRTKKYANLPRS